MKNKLGSMYLAGPGNQDDLFGRIFGQMGDCLLCAVFLKITELTHIFELLFFLRMHCELILTKMCLAAFWAFFSQTHLVTLPAMLSSMHK
jgi:hypothetical protein